jgi:haloacetate dehalogenase
VVGRCFEPLKEWQKVANDVRGYALPSGHYIAEEAPDSLLQAVGDFFPELLAARSPGGIPAGR